MKIIIYILFAIIISGCYPINKTIQPRAEMVVINEVGNPVSDAVVTLIAGAYPYGEERTRMSIKTDYSGKAEFPIIKDWRIESLMIHGAEHYFWSWCVYKEGFLTYEVGNGGSGEFTPNAHIILEAGVATPCSSILEQWETVDSS
ncbi:hypothetical protein ACJJI3_00600 [Microbulbifer sp. ZKSA004]|uniref:hypothetical protein n=1 Tax=Microbulbifer sp. ZKSA004 TaxID=3243389 RepID=UPI0040396110